MTKKSAEPLNKYPLKPKSGGKNDNGKNTTARKPGGNKAGRKSGKRKKRKKPRHIRISLWIVALLILTIAALIAFPYLKARPSDGKGASIPRGDYLYGIDISHYQSGIKWDSLMVLTDGAGRTIKSKTYAKEIKPVSFVFIKATEGANMRDKHFKKHWKSAGKADISRGAYHFFRSSKDGVQQAMHFIRTVGSLHYKDLPPVLDIETIHSGCTDKMLNDRALDWLRTVEEHYGRKPIVYSSAYFIKNHLSREITDNYTIWVAHYEADRPAFGNWTIWQFTDKALVYGIEGPVDLNVRKK